MVEDAAPTDLARGTLDRARDHLLGLQHAEGWWQGELETNVTMDAEDLLLREFLGLHDDAVITPAGRWIRSQQRGDGTWANFYGGPADLSTTVEAYLALRLAGDEPDAPHMKLARDWITEHGGVEATRVFTRIWLALSGLWSWDDLPVIPPELIYLPSWFPLNIYDWGCWARQTIVALAVVQSFRPARPIGISIDELNTGGPHGRAPRPLRDLDARPTGGTTSSADPWARFFNALDHALHRYRPVKSVRRAALRRCAEWIIARQEKDGCWGGIQPPWVYSLMAMNLLGYDLDHPVMAKGIAGLDRYTITEDTADGPVRRLEACQSPVWDTILTMIALADAGLAADDPSLGRAARWVLDEEIRGPGDWQVRRPDVVPGGWAFEFDNDNYPDTDDTAEVVLALRRVAPKNQAAIDRALTWLAGMQSKDGGWGAFDADNTRKLVNKLPFCDFGAVIDPPSADVTAHIVEAFAAEGRATEPAARRGVVWLLRAQEPDGSWFGRWGANYLYGTGAVVPALIAAGVRPGKPAIRRAVAWLEQHQNPDGGWGEDLRSYDDRALGGRGESTASQTAWALLALLAAGERENPATERGIRWLAQTQRDDGTWDEPWFTGTGFPGDFYINYHLYRLAFPVSALGRYVHGGDT
ncbi:MAG TPA: squalene--hopene cyclase [Streptosporangiaceae bacterium]|nr:squalene--hopene cyclase [Streptosporangiaceae bacterium]